MVEGKWFAQGSDIAKPLAIRQTVLGRGRDAVDDLAQQVVVYHENRPAGTARLWWSDGVFMLGDVCVLPQYRHQGYGDLLVRLLLYKALTHNAQSVALFSPKDCVAFFARYGFTAGEEGDVVRMHLHAKDICLSCRHAKA